MTLHQLRIFDVVTRHLNITKASAELHLSQPSVFQQIKSLEESCGVRLYRKVGRGIRLTAAGEKLHAEAREILEKVTTLEQKFEANRNSPATDPLRVGGSHVPSKSVLPSCLAAFKLKHPLVGIELHTKTSRSIENLVLNAELEIAVITHPSNSSHLHYVPLRQEEVVLFVSTHHPLAGKKDLSLRRDCGDSADRSSRDSKRNRRVHFGDHKTVRRTSAQAQYTYGMQFRRRCKGRGFERRWDRHFDADPY